MMRFVTILSVAIIIYGLSYLRYAVTQIYLLSTHALNPTLLKYMLLNLNIGLVTFVLGIGLIRAKEWARITWLIVSIVLLVLHGAILFFGTNRNFTLPILNFIVI